LVCMAASTHARWLQHVGSDPIRERYTICSWPWETQQWPDTLMPLLDVADELWPSSQFAASALAVPALNAGMPMHVIPMAAEISEPDRFLDLSAQAATRTRFGIPTDTVVFVHSFDLNSTAIRKNPAGALEVFQRAFPLPHLPATFGRECTRHPLSDQVSLVIKTFPPHCFSAEWEWLRARAAEDGRITVIADSLSRDDLLSLYGACDVFLSLHRSEGFGRAMAEALQLGLDVIATDFGGNTDFCVGPLAHPVCCRKVPVPRGSYPYADGHTWAEPDLDHAMEICLQVAERRLKSKRNREFTCYKDDSFALGEYRRRFSFEHAGYLYRERLEALWKERVCLLGKNIKTRV